MHSDVLNYSFINIHISVENLTYQQERSKGVSNIIVNLMFNNLQMTGRRSKIDFLCNVVNGHIRRRLVFVIFFKICQGPIS